MVASANTLNKPPVGMVGVGLGAVEIFGMILEMFGR
jgi:hypothetical protein